MVQSRSSAKGRSFRHSTFPFRWKGHSVLPLRDSIYVSEEDRLFVHLVLYCDNCEDEHSVRGHLPPSHTDYDYWAATAKFIALGKYNYECGST